VPRTTVKVVRGFFIHGAAPGGPTSGGLLGARAHGWSRPAVAAGAPGGRGRPSAGGAVATRCGNGLASIARFMRRSARISEVGLEAEGAHSPVCQHENPSLWAIVSAPGVPEVEMLRKLVAAVAALTCLLVLPIASARAQGGRCAIVDRRGRRAVGEALPLRVPPSPPVPPPVGRVPTRRARRPMSPHRPRRPAPPQHANPHRPRTPTSHGKPTYVDCAGQLGHGEHVRRGRSAGRHPR
jgi:hypothetical protein